MPPSNLTGPAIDDLQALGWKVGRVTNEHLDEPEAVLVDIRAMLGADPANSPG